MNKIDKDVAFENLRKEIFDLNDSIKSEIRVNCLNVSKGSKLAAYIPVKERNKIKLDKIKIIVKSYSLNSEIIDFPDNKSKNEGWKGIYIFKHEQIRHLISQIDSLPNNSKLYHFALGKLFGYGNSEIMDFIDEYN